MSDRFAYPQALPPEEFRRLGAMALDIAARHLETVADRPMRPHPPAEIQASILDQPLPEEGKAPEDILSFFETQIMPHARGNGHPGFMGWVISPPSHMAILTELPGVAMDSPCGGGGQGATYLEWCAIRWIKELLGYDTPDSHGLFVSGGSMANLTALAAARHAAAERAGWDMRRDGMRGAPDFKIYTSSETHACVTKSMELMGMGNSAIRLIRTDSNYRIDINELKNLIEKDIKDGSVPFCVVGSAGTVNTGAVDDLDALADLCQHNGIWFHVDGAYGAFGALDPERAGLFQGMERADSIALDPHKWLSVPFDCGCVLVRDRQNLRNCFSLTPAYIRSASEIGDDLGSPHEYSFQLTRAFRALKVWSTLSHVGARAFRETVSRHNTIATQLAKIVEESDDLELLAPSSLSIVCFRYAPPALAGDNERLNAVNRALVDLLQK
ncbi:MAG: aminotransferase class V-fold PLP-dependent enzyme, partial [Rhodospirillaceae bacterium]|nr:aminotransferase class V-fold PLP-dependent enzyme [Rhodospirillaceae bacterium]